MTPALGIASVVPMELIYGEGLVWGVVIVVFAFFFVAYTAGEWFVGAGFLVALVTALFMYTGWQLLADYPLKYRDGDRPVSSTSGASLYETWQLGPGAKVDTQFTVSGASDADSLAGVLGQHGCSSSIDWRVYADGNLLAAGTLRNRDEQDFEDLPVPTGKASVVVRLYAARTDSADCTTELAWENPGVEGPGHGKFRFVFPMPDPE